MSLFSLIFFVWAFIDSRYFENYNYQKHYWYLMKGINVDTFHHDAIVNNYFRAN